MAPQRLYQRRIVFIKKGYQFRFILKFCLILVAGGLISTALVTLLSKGTLTTSFEHGRLLVRSTAAAIFPTVVLTNSITLVIVVVIAIATVLLISHKIAGPMFRFEKELSAVKTGDLSIRVKLRKKDQFEELSDSLNEMIGGLHQKISVLETALVQLKESASESKTPENIINDIESIHRRLRTEFRL